MTEAFSSKGNGARRAAGKRGPMEIGLQPQLVHPAWLSFVRFCEEMGHGEIERLKIQDGLPVLAEVTSKKVKFAP